MAKRTTSSARAERVIEWIERYCCHVKGKWAGHPLILSEWEREWIRKVFGPVNKDGLRTVRTALLGIPRKNGKSTFGAAIALYLLIGDAEPGAEVYSVATDTEQARLVFDMAAEMVRAGPLARYATPRRNWIEVPRTLSVYRVLSADSKTKDGLNPHGVVFDELHAQPDRKLWDVLTSAQGAREQPLVLAITTAGYDQKSICFEQYDYGRQVARGVIDDPTFSFTWYGADKDARWDDPAVWEEVNPGYGESVSPDFLEAECKKAKHTPARQNTFRRLYLNQWTQAADRWLDLDAWDATAGMVVEDKLKGRACFGGLDLATTTDIAALAWVFPMGDDEYEAIWRFFIAEAQLPKLDKRTAGAASVWAREGWLQVNPGNVIDYNAVIDTMDGDAQTFQVSAVAFDRWGSHKVAQELGEAGMTMVAMGQGFASMSPPTKDMERLVLQKRFHHGGNPVMRWMIDNVVVRQDPAGNIKPDKQKSSEKIDGVVAAIMGLDAAMRTEPKKRSAYEDRGMEVV